MGSGVVCVFVCVVEEEGGEKGKEGGEREEERAIVRPSRRVCKCLESDLLDFVFSEKAIHPKNGKTWTNEKYKKNEKQKKKNWREKH